MSDFYIPREKMLEHKIQSAGGGLDLSLDPVPKMYISICICINICTIFLYMYSYTYPCILKIVNFSCYHYVNNRSERGVNGFIFCKICLLSATH